ARLGAALGRMLEMVGAVLIFLVVDLLVALVLVVALRGVTGTFVSVYVIDDTVWLGLALLQGLAFQWWREVSARQAGGRPAAQGGKLGGRGDARRERGGHARQLARGGFPLLRGVPARGSPSYL